MFFALHIARFGIQENDQLFVYGYGEPPCDEGSEDARFAALKRMQLHVTITTSRDRGMGIVSTDLIVSTRRDHSEDAIARYSFLKSHPYTQVFEREGS